MWNGLRSLWVVIRCFRTNIQLMNVPPAPESTMAVVCNDFPTCLREKRVTGTRSSFFFPTALVTSTGGGETDVATVPRFKNPAAFFQLPSHHLLHQSLRSCSWILHHQVFCALPVAFLWSSFYHLLGSSLGNRGICGLVLGSGRRGPSHSIVAYLAQTIGRPP